MSGAVPDRISLPRRTFGIDESALDDTETPHPEPSVIRKVLGRVSFGSSQHRSSFVARWRSGADGSGVADVSTPERPAIPTMMQASGEADTTPLPILSMVVLSITMLGEFLSANVSTPFLLFMVKGFGEVTDEAGVAFWTGILVSTFFMTQFLTSLLWATVAEKHGRRVVLTISLLGSAVTCLAFGTSTSLQQAICLRLLQGIFAGAVGVARGSVAFITDPSNEGRAYAILGFCWGFGGVAGAIIGGSFERPATKWPGMFENTSLFVKYPYLLPCALAALVTFIGSILSCFLSRDGGPREGAIRLLPEKLDPHPPIPEEESVPSSPLVDQQQSHDVVSALRHQVSKKLSGYFSKRVHDAHSPSDRNPIAASISQSSVPAASPGTRLERTRTFSRTSRANGSAYGYAGGYRNRLASNATTARRGSMASSLRRRRGSNYDRTRESVSDGTDLNFAQRLLMANENAVTNIADLWVAAAMNVENEDPFESDSEAGSESGSLELTEAVDGENDNVQSSDPSTPTRRGRGDLRALTADHSPSPRILSSHRPSISSSQQTPAQRFSSPYRPSSSQRIPTQHGSTSFSQPLDGTPMSRRLSTTAPSIFTHSGVKAPAAVLDAQQLSMRLNADDTPAADALAPILESRRASGANMQHDVEAVSERPPSLSSQLPYLVIFQYGMLALHSTTHDQIFMSYLVSDYESGGLNLNAGHFAQLIALMCLAQIAYQFYLYPNIGPPRGRFSHLAMFRLGSLLFIPAYLSVVLYRPLASAEDDGNFLLMTALVVSTFVKFKFCATCRILIHASQDTEVLRYHVRLHGYIYPSKLYDPSERVGYANGIAQSIVSLARCFGPVLGGYLWSASIQDNPSGYPLGFIVCAGVCAFAVAQSYMIR
ncbi:hypothetical protein BD779DRAFT_322787 [Infundibulicybe gibba]|nr:hypothetical protein BD779DRAFT_322787 [Infundibulicybe gibba]